MKTAREETYGGKKPEGENRWREVIREKESSKGEVGRKKAW